MGDFYEMDSDSFFKHHPQHFDVAFIDGDHSHEQSSRDLFNCLAWMNEGGAIVLHDCNPQSADEATPVFGKSANWCGEVWKTVVDVRWRDFLSVQTFDCDFGVAVVEVKNNKNRLNIPHEDIHKLTYEDLDVNRKEFLNLVNV
jgi:hypothetical protein